MKKLILFTMVVVSGCSSPGYYGPSDSREMIPGPGEILTIHYSNGGSVGKSQVLFDEMKKNGTKVRIDGSCMSSCTFLLSYDNVCYTRETKFVFHGSTVNGGPAFKNVFVSNYPPKVAEWAIRAGALEHQDKYVTVTGEEMSKIEGIERFCE